MKGHLGFRCRACLRPSEPQNLRQVGVGSIGNAFSATLAWDAPSFTGDGQVLGYKVEQAANESSTEWQTVAETDASTRQVNLLWCEFGVFRVSARNRCGWGASASFAGWTFTGGGTVALITASTSLTPPCWAKTAKFWAVGRGGTMLGGGAGGGLSIKTWTRGQAWSGPFVCIVRHNYLDEDSPPLASVSYGGVTATGYGATTFDPGTATGGDSNYAGNPGGSGYGAYSGQSYASITYPFTGPTQYSGNYEFGGGIGGATGTNQDGTAIRPLPVSPCRRHPAADRGGLMSAVSLLGMRVVEECAADPAFGSGGVTFSVPAYGGGSQRVDFAPGYGGGGFDATNPGQPGCIVVQWS